MPAISTRHCFCRPRRYQRCCAPCGWGYILPTPWEITCYFQELLDNLDYVPESVINLLQMSRSNMEVFDRMQKLLISALRLDPQISRRVELLMSILGVGEVTALSWVLEIGEVKRFGSICQAVSYCGLCSAQKESAGKRSHQHQILH